MPIEERLFRTKRKEAERRGIEWELGLEEFANLVIQRCAYCGSPPSNEYRRGEEVFPYSGIDRIDSSLPYAKDNVYPCCRFCNVLKSAMPPDDWFDFLNGVIVTHDGEIPSEWKGFKSPGRAKKAPNFWSRPGKR